MKDLVRKSESQCGFVYLFCIYPWVSGRYLIFRKIEKEKGGALSGNGFENESFMFRVINILFDFRTLDWPGIVKNSSCWYIRGVIPASRTNRTQRSQIQNIPQPTTVMELWVLNTAHVNSIHPACTSNWLVMDPRSDRGIPSSFSKPRELCSEGIQDGSRVSECITGQVTVYDTNPRKPPTFWNSHTRTLILYTIMKLSGTIGVTQKTMTFDTHVCLILLHRLKPQERWGTHKKRWPFQPRPFADVIGLVRCSYYSSMTWTVSKKLMLYNGFGVLTVLWSYFTS